MSRRQADRSDVHAPESTSAAASTTVPATDGSSGNVPSASTSSASTSGATPSSTSLVRFERSALSVSGLVLLTATKFTDALTTGFGLQYVPGIYEANPLVDSVFHRIGVVDGLVWSSFVVIAAITLLTETAAVAVSARRRDGHLAPIVRIVGYGIPSLCFAAVSVYNVSILLAGLEAAAIV